MIMKATRLNALALYTNFIVLGAVGLFMSPLMVRALGIEQFGIWKACLRLLELSSVADGRTSQALKWIVAHRHNEQEKLDKQRDVGAALVIWLVWIPILSIAIATIVIFLPNLISQISAANLSESRWLAALLGLNIVFGGLLGISDATLVGTNQGYRSYLLSTIFVVASNLAMLLAAWAGYGLVGVGAAAVLGSALNGVTTWLIARRFVEWWGIARPRRIDLRRVLSFSNLTMLAVLFQSLMLSSEVLIIGYISGPVEVGKYVFTSYASMFVLSLCLMTGSAVSPQLGAIIGRGAFMDAVALQNKTREIVLAILTVGAISLTLCNGPFVRAWAGNSFYQGDLVNLGIVGVTIQHALIRFDSQLQDVGLRIGKKVLWMGMSSVLAIFLGTLFYRVTGDLSMMFGGIIIGRLPLQFIFPRLMLDIIPGHDRYIGRTVIMVLLVLCTFFLAKIWPISGWMGVFMTAFLSMTLGGLATFQFVLTAPTRRQLLGKLKGT